MISDRVAAALVLSAELGGAQVTVDTPLGLDAAAALAQEIRAGLEGPGLPLTVRSLTVRGDPPRVAAITVTVTASPACTCTDAGGVVMVDDAGRCTFCGNLYL